MPKSWHDVSIPLNPNTIVWPGDPAFLLEPMARIQEGASCNTSKIVMSTHTGTHCDAPWHFIDNGLKLERVPHDLFFGEALVIDLPTVEIIHVDDLPQKPLPKRIVFKTRNSEKPTSGTFDKDFVALSEDAALRLVADEVQLVGIDALSIAPFGNGTPIHQILLKAGIFIIEGLRLHNIPQGTHEFVVLPLAIEGADGSPCRAFIYF